MEEEITGDMNINKVAKFGNKFKVSIKFSDTNGRIVKL